MSTVSDALRAVLCEPSPGRLVDLQGALLACDPPIAGAERALEVAGAFHSYLCNVESKTTAQEFSELASRLDMGAVGLVALENLVGEHGAQFWKELLLGAVGEGMMVAASRQYVRAWHTETEVVHREAAWYLTGALWQMSCDLQPALPPEPRLQAIRSLLAPASDPKTPAPQKALLLGRLFQLLLFIRLS